MDHVVVMGVSGSGKSTVGRALADALAVPFADGDAFHPAANVAKMAAGVPLVQTLLDVQHLELPALELQVGDECDRLAVG